MFTEIRESFSHPLFQPFALTGLFCGTVITLLTFGAYIWMAGPNLNKAADASLTSVLLVGYAFYQFIICWLAYVMYKKGSDWEFCFLIFIAVPVMVFFFGGITPPFRLLFLFVIASLAVYQSLTVGYRRIQARAKEKLKQPLH